MELKPNMYVRTKEGNIEKICAIENEHIYTDEDYLSWYPSSNAISKASHNIIDLIEVGDYVNGLLVIDKYYDYANKEWRLNDRDGLICIENNIKSIVTKEQFSSMEYRLGE